MVQNPLHFGAGKVGVDEQAGGLLDVIPQPRRLQALALRSGAAALPDNGVAHRNARGSIPSHGGLPLVGDADGRNIPRRGPGALHRLAHGVEGGLQNLYRVVLHIARLGVNLPELLLAHSRDAAKGVEQHRPGTGGTLVNGENVSPDCHNCPLLFGGWGICHARKSPLRCPASFRAQGGPPPRVLCAYCITNSGPLQHGTPRKSLPYESFW